MKRKVPGIKFGDNLARILAENVDVEVDEEIKVDKEDGRNEYGKIDFPNNKGKIFRGLVGECTSTILDNSEKYASEDDLKQFVNAYLESKGFMYNRDNVDAITEACRKKFKKSNLFDITGE